MRLNGHNAIFRIMMECSLTLDSCIRGYHVYQDTWLAMGGETLNCLKELYNRSDPFSVAVKMDIEVVGHVPSITSVLFHYSYGMIVIHHAV